MPNATKCLRSLVIAEWVFAVAAGVAWCIEFVIREQLLGDLGDPDPPYAAVEGLLVLLVGPPLLGLHLVASVGLFRLRRWARPLYVVGTILSCILSAFLTPWEIGGVGGTLIDLSSASWGGILALLYFSDASRHFRRPPAPEGADGGVPRAVGA